MRMPADAFALPADLTGPERALVTAAAAGEICGFDAAAPEAARRIRAAVIVALLRGHATWLTALGLRLRWAVIEGPLDLAGLGSEEAPAPPLVLWDSTGPGVGSGAGPSAGLDLELTGAVLAELDLRGTGLARIEARDLVLRRRLLLNGCRASAGATLTMDGARIGGDVFLDGARIAGEVRFLGAGIGGQFSARAGTRITCEHGVALACDAMEAKGGVFLNGASITGEVRFPGAKIGGQFNAGAETTITHEDGPALTCDGIQVEGGVFLKGACITGEVRFLSAEIGTQFSTGTATRITRAQGTALACDSMLIKGDVLLDGSTITGQVRFPGAEIGGAFSVGAGTKLIRENGEALYCDGMRVKGDVLLDGSAITGEVSFLSVAINGTLSARGGTRIVSPGGNALACYSATIRGDVSLRGATCDGRLDFREAEIGRLFDLRGATLVAGQGGACSLDAVGLKLGGDLRLDAAPGAAQPLSPATCTGAVLLDRARIEGALILTGATLRSTPGDAEDVALSLEQARIEARIEVSHLPAETRGVFDLRGARTGLLDDAGGTGWGEPCHPAQPEMRDGKLRGVRLRLEGFTYDRLPDFEDAAAGSADAKARSRRRLAFLMRQFPGETPQPHHFAPQPFDQLERVLRAAGYPQEADWFARQKNEFRRRCKVDPLAGRWWNGFVGFFFGHYYSVGRAFMTLGLMMVLGITLLGLANHTGAYAKKRNEIDLSPAALAELRLRPAPGIGPPPPDRERCWKPDAFAGHWSPALSRGLEVTVMALDLLLPLVDLKQDNRCEVDTDRDEHRLWSSALAVYSGLGLVILPMFLATVSGIVRRDSAARH
ncbi:hypothetical protein CKO45_22415 [Paracraurococcus ruber]|uniref:Membrane-associated oxidoreductase n=2 Tax=Paracraurococcus ruber TaxID=77675 RepID=A0ABS1D2F9_9PROT|nr:hypothetical protein [Paracraurococcus ruber]